MKVRLFVSYSRKDSKQARKLIDRFATMGYDIWVDWEDIPPATNWLDQIKAGIEASDAFIFFISPDSAASEVCNVEVNHAAKYNKRIIPIVLRDVPAKETNNVVRQLNWIFMRAEDDIEKSFARFKDAVELDFEWVAEHNDLLKKTLDWHHGKTTSLLLRGTELRRVHNVVKAAKGKEPKLTSLQDAFLRESAQAERRRYVLYAIVAAVLIVLSGLTYFAVVQRNLAQDNAFIAKQNEQIAQKNADTALQNARDARRAQQTAEEQRQIAQEQALIAIAQQSAARAQIYQSQPGELYTSTLLAIGSFTTSPSEEAGEILRKNISLLPVPVVQMKQDGRINSLTFNAAGDLFVTGSADGQACVWKASDGERLFCAPSPKSVNDAVFTPNGMYLVTGDDSGLVQIIEVQSQKVVGTFEAGAIVYDVDVRKNGDQIAVTRDDGKITLLDLSGKRKYDLQAFGSLKIVSFSPDGLYIAAGSSAGTVTLWNIGDGTAVSSGRHKGEVRSLVFSPNSRYLITGGQDGYAVAARTNDGQEVYRVLHEDWVEGITFNADSSWFATVSNDKRIRLWDTTDGDERLRMSQDNFVSEAKVSANGQWLATTGTDRTVRVWNTSTGAEMFQIPLNGDGTVLGFNGDGTKLVAGDSRGEIHIWDISVMPVPVNYLQFSGLTGDVSFSPSGEWVAASDGPRVWLLRSDQLSTLTPRSLGSPLFALNGNVNSIVFSSDSSWLGIVTENGQGVLYNLQTRAQKTIFQTGLQHRISFSTDNTKLFSSSAQGVDSWTLSGYTNARIIENISPSSLAISPDYIALGRTDMIQLFSTDAKQAAEIASPGDHPFLAFSPDGSLLASSNSDGVLEVWKIGANGFEQVGSTRKEAVYAMAFNPTGTQLALGTTNTVYLIDLSTVEEVARIPHAGTVTGVSFSADGNTLVTTSNRALQAWDLTQLLSLAEGDLVAAACSRLTVNLSETQWHNFFGKAEYRILCEALPAP